MKVKKLTAGIAAAVMAVSSLAVNGFAETSLNRSNASVMVDSELTVDDASTNNQISNVSSGEAPADPGDNSLYYGNYKYKVNEDNTVVIVSYNGGVEADVVIPSEIYGKRVTRINMSAFNNKYYITSITIPNSVTSIGREAFRGCPNLKSITIPNSVTSIGDSAFYWCTSLTSVTIPNSVTEIGFHAFGYYRDEDFDYKKIENFKIYCYSNTQGEQYAKANGFKYELFKPTLSRVTGAKLTGRAADALRINWIKNTSADGYIVEMYQGNKWVRVGKITNNSTTTFRKAGLKASSVYKFRVRAYKMSGKTALYGNYSATVTARTNPSIVKGVKIAGKAKDALRVNWTKNASAQGYIVEMYKGGKWVRVAKITNGNTTTFRKAGLAKNTTYKFRVKAYYMSGKTALYGNYGSVSGKTAAK